MSDLDDASICCTVSALDRPVGRVAKLKCLARPSNSMTADNVIMHGNTITHVAYGVILCPWTVKLVKIAHKLVKLYGAILSGFVYEYWNTM